MSTGKENVLKKIARDSLISLLLYSFPIFAMFAYFFTVDKTPWRVSYRSFPLQKIQPNLIWLNNWGWPTIIISLGLLEFSLGLYKRKLDFNEFMLDCFSLFIPRVLVKPFIVYFSLVVLPRVIPEFKDVFFWVPFWWGFIIITLAIDLTDYWYHRLHHQIPFLWRFHRTHHSAPYMGVSMAFRINAVNAIFIPHVYLLVALSYLGLGSSAILFLFVRTLITLSAHSNIRWDKPFYDNKILHPLIWILERTISTPATHYAHHAYSNNDGIGFYKGNFGSILFIWDLIFGTARITRKYPQSFGIKNYKQEKWYVQLAWPIIKSREKGSEISQGGPIVADEEDDINTDLYL